MGDLVTGGAAPTVAEALGAPKPIIRLMTIRNAKATRAMMGSWFFILIKETRL